MDILTGSYHPGHLYWFRKLEDGSFAKGEILTNKDGEKIVVGAASTPFAVDWDGDGDIDLLVGDIQGNVWFAPNESGDKGLKFGKHVKLGAGGKDITAGHGDSQPIVVDWDEDGRLDLVVAHGDGAVYWHRNTSKEGAPVLAAGEVLIAAPAAASRGSTAAGPAAIPNDAPGTRAKICVTDVNGDGRLDIWLGDFGYRMLPPPNLTDEQLAEKAKLEKRYSEIMEKMRPIREKAVKAAKDAVGGKEFKDMSAEERKKYSETLTKTMNDDPDYKSNLQEMREVNAALSKYRGTSEYRGNVWLFAAKSETPAEKPREAAPVGEPVPEKTREKSRS